MKISSLDIKNEFTGTKLSVPKIGNNLAILGENGTGKSVLLQMIYGYLHNCKEDGIASFKGKESPLPSLFKIGVKDFDKGFPLFLNRLNSFGNFKDKIEESPAQQLCGGGYNYAQNNYNKLLAIKEEGNLKKNHPDLFKIFDIKESLSYSEYSEGQKRILGIMLRIRAQHTFNEIIYEKPDNSVVFLDEPEISISMKNKRRLIETILKEGNNIQIILATHDESILNGFSDDEIVELK